MTTFDSPSYNAFLWENGVMLNLNGLIPSDSSVLLIQATANAINDAGQIVCTYRNVTNSFYGVCLLNSEVEVAALDSAVVAPVTALKLSAQHSTQLAAVSSFSLPQ
jgi:hypothetical protein